jgi:hypothetical protein
MSETFVEQTELPEPNYLDWIRGTYTASIPISDGPADQGPRESEVFVPLALHLDFSKERDEIVHWTIDTRPSKIRRVAGYPGIHCGYFRTLNLGSFNSVCEVIWETPIFSPYINIDTPYRGGDREDLRPITMKCMRFTNSGDIVREAGHLETVFLGSRGYNCHVNVLQRILRDIGRLLVFGPRYEDMRVVPICPYEDLFKSPGVDKRMKAEFFDSPHFPEAARFFSRVFCRASLGADESMEDPVPQSRCEASVQTIEALFEHFSIVCEPLWVETQNGDWVDDMEAEAAALKTMGEWLEFERKWAIVASYACRIGLHEGPWAGNDWRMYVDISP